MLELLGIALAAGGGIAGYVTSKGFTQKRLRFVDAVHKPGVALLAGAVAGAVTLPFWILPAIGVGTAVAVGTGVALGVKSAQRSRNILP